MIDDRGPRAQDGRREPSLCDVTSAENCPTPDASYQGVASDVELSLMCGRSGGGPKLLPSCQPGYFGVSLSVGAHTSRFYEYTTRDFRNQWYSS